MNGIWRCGAGLALSLALAACVDSPVEGPDGATALGPQFSSHVAFIANGAGVALCGPAHSHMFRFTIVDRGGVVDVNLSYTDLHTPPLPGSGTFTYDLHGTPPIFQKIGQFIYLEGPAIPSGPGGPPGPAVTICVWIEDGTPDRFHLESAGGYGSGSPAMGCPGWVGAPPLPLGHALTAGGINVF